MKEGGTKAEGNTRKRKEKKKGREQKRRKRHYQEKEDGATEERTAPFIYAARAGQHLLLATSSLLHFFTL